MIVCSKRAFLNVLTQLLSKDELLSANYYIADQANRNGIVRTDDMLTLNDDGEYVLQTAVKSQAPTLNPYNIIYGDNIISPASCISLVLSDMANGTPFDCYKSHLLANDTMISMYRLLHKTKVRGNGLKIMIFAVDNHAEMMHIMCEYLSEMFGEDITFLDKYYRNDIPGKTTYIGNKQHADIVLRYIEEMILISDIHDMAISYQGGYGGDANLDAYLNAFEIPQLFHIYETIWGNNPLPPGDYTKERIIHIIKSRIKSEFPKKFMFPNLMIPSLDEMVEMYNNVSDEETMSTNWE